MDLRSIGAQFQNLNTRDPGSWPAWPKAAVFFGIFLAILGLGYQFYWKGQMEELETARADEQKLRQEFQSKMQQAINLDELKRQKEQVGQYVLSLEKQLPSKAEMDALLSDINQAGVGRGLSFELFKPGSAQAKEYYAELPIAIKISGNFHDIGAFASDLAALPRIVTLNNLNVALNQKDQSLLLDATAKTFRYLDPDEVAEQRKNKQAAAAKGGATPPKPPAQGGAK
ncbi:MAG: Pilus assembly protein PilO precursor [Pseudomonadota bacterium]|jgi:type IV pilus assembly protein PilO